MTEPDMTPAPETIWPASGGNKSVTLLSSGAIIRYNKSTTGFPAAPATILEGSGGASPVAVTVDWRFGTTYIVAVAFDPAGVIAPSPVASGAYFMDPEL